MNQRLRVSNHGIEMAHTADKLIGKGRDRCIYSVKGKPDLVLKAEILHQKCSQNGNEFYLWEHVEDKGISEWFCPVVEMSRCERYMYMKRARTPVTKNNFYSSLPNFMAFMDCALANWGYYENGAVMVDYGLQPNYYELSELLDMDAYCKIRIADDGHVYFLEGRDPTDMEYEEAGDAYFNPFSDISNDTDSSESMNEMSFEQFRKLIQ